MANDRMAEELSVGQETLRRQYPAVPIVRMYGDSVADWPRDDLIRALNFTLADAGRAAQRAARHLEVLRTLKPRTGV